MAIDRYDRVADNLAAIAATLEAMRAIERHGGAEILDRAFTGFASLPASAGQGKREWWAVFGVSANASDADIEAAYRRLAKERHPDTGGSDDAMAELNQARDEWRKSKSLTP
jgi:DnaJ-domain-containing protein 1